MALGSSDVVDPDGVHWTVRRRWYPWRRALSLRQLGASTTSNGKAAAGPDAAPRESTELPRNFLLKIAFVVLGAIVWVVYGLGKVLFYAIVVLLYLVISSVELLLELVVMPITLLLRLIGASTWPVEITRDGEHVATRHGADFATAGEVRDGVLAELRRGVPPVVERGDSKPESMGSFED